MYTKIQRCLIPLKSYLSENLTFNQLGKKINNKPIFVLASQLSMCMHDISGMTSVRCKVLNNMFVRNLPIASNTRDFPDNVYVETTNRLASLHHFMSTLRICYFPCFCHDGLLHPLAKHPLY